MSVFAQIKSESNHRFGVTVVLSNASSGEVSGFVPMVTNDGRTDHRRSSRESSH
jgi:hypothetical protein